MFFLHNFYPSPDLGKCCGLVFHWYGLLIALSLYLGYFVAARLFKYYRYDLNRLPAVTLILTASGIIGARLWHVAVSWPYYYAHPFDIVAVWRGGLAIHGAVVAGLLALYYSSRRFSLNFWRLADIFVVPLALGQALGRWGNYFNQELYGRPTDSLWSLPIDLAHRLTGYEAFHFFQPLFLYESAWCLTLFIFLFYLHYLNHSRPARQTLWKRPGNIAALYLILYSLERFFIGFWRIDPQFAWLGLRLDQWLSLILILLGASLLARHLFNPKRKIGYN